jgi:hypothetical protein
MRSTAFTLFLALLALLVCGAIGWRIKEGNLDAIFGMPPVPPGERLYRSFKAEDVQRIRISGNSGEGSFIRTDAGWQSVQEPIDRMDPRSAGSIIGFTLGMVVHDSALRDEINEEQAGLEGGRIQIELESADGKSLAKYRMGGLTPMKVEDVEAKQIHPTVFINPRERGQREYVYACSGNILPLFKDGLKRLRDHRPFYFNPTALEKVRLRGNEGELTLGRETPQSAWRIVKPLELGTDPAAVKTLLEGLFNLQALKIENRSTVTLPPASPKAWQVALQSFGQEKETVLDIFPPETADARTALAIVSDRPDTVFEIPIKPVPDIISFSDLPLSVNALRDPKLTNLNIASLRTISIRPSTGPEILITREPPKPWTAVIDGRSHQANEQRLFDLLKTVTSGRAVGFESDAAADLKPWGLDRPFLSLQFLGEGHQGIQLNFGMDGYGGYFVNRLGTPTVMRIDPQLISSIAIHPHEWRHALLWTISRVDLFAIERIDPTGEPLNLYYDFLNETWKAEKNGVDLSAEIDPAKANFMLTALEKLNVSRWLSGDDPDAAAALATPALILTVVEKKVDDLGDFKTLEGRELKLAPVPGKSPPQFYYGSLSGEQNLFLLDAETFEKISLDLMDQR